MITTEGGFPMNVPLNLLYTKSHEWVENLGGGRARIGLTDYAQHELGDIVFVGLPELGDAATSGERLADVESVKAVSDVYSPVSGTVAAVNEALLDDPGAINTDAYGAWLAEIEGVTELAGLLSAAEYAALTGEA
jgi:glycine cleavage system H protein